MVGNIHFPSVKKRLLSGRMGFLNVRCGFVGKQAAVRWRQRFPLRPGGNGGGAAGGDGGRQRYIYIHINISLTPFLHVIQDLTQPLSLSLSSSRVIHTYQKKKTSFSFPICL